MMAYPWYFFAIAGLFVLVTLSLFLEVYLYLTKRSIELALSFKGQSRVMNVFVSFGHNEKGLRAISITKERYFR